MRRRSIMPKPVQRVTVPSCLCEVGQKVHPGPTPMAPAVHENDRPRALHGCEWHEALNAHAMNPVLRLIHADLPGDTNVGSRPGIRIEKCRTSPRLLRFLSALP